MAEAAGSERLSSVGNAARVLKAFTSRQREFGVSELARSLELSTSSVHRILSTLRAEHLVEQDPETGKYRLGLAIYDLAAAVTAGFDLTHAILQPMAVLRNRTGETVHVAVLDGREVVYIERLDSPHTLRMFLDVGRRNWAHSTASGKVLLAHLADADLGRVLDGWHLPAVTDATLVDARALRTELRRVRRNGHAINRGESEPDVVSVAAPIRDRAGMVVAAMSVAGSANRMDEDLPSIIHTVTEAAAAASKRLGYKKGVG